MNKTMIPALRELNSNEGKKTGLISISKYILCFGVFLNLFLFREREREGKRGEKCRLVASRMYPDWRPNLQPRPVP